MKNTLLFHAYLRCHFLSQESVPKHYIAPNEQYAHLHSPDASFWYVFDINSG